MRYSKYSETGIRFVPYIPSSWMMVKNRSILRENKEVSLSGNEPLLSLSQYTGISKKPEQSTAGMSRAESLIGYRVVEPDDIVMNIMLAWNGSTAVSKFKGLISPAYAVFKSISPNVSSRYLHYLYRTPSICGYFRSYSTGIIDSRLRLYPQVFLQLSSVVPPRGEQDQIVKYLDWQVSKINRLIKSKREQLLLVKEYLHSAFRNTMNSNCSLIKLKRLVELEREMIHPDSEQLYRKAGMYNRGRGIFLREKCPGKELGDSQFQTINSGRLMISGQFAWEDAVYITDQKDETGIASHRYYLLNPIEAIPVEYLFAFFLSDEGIAKLNQCSHGSAGRNRPLNINELLNLYIPIPDNTDAFKKITNVVRAYMRMQLLQKDKESLLTEYRTRLISDVVTGQIDVRGIEIPDYAPEEDIEDEAVNEETEDEEVSGDE